MRGRTHGQGSCPAGSRAAAATWAASSGLDLPPCICASCTTCGTAIGVAFEDEMVELYPLCTFGRNPVAASIDTPLHGCCRSLTSTTCTPTGACGGRIGQRPRATRRAQPPVRPPPAVAAVAAAHDGSSEAGVTLRGLPLELRVRCAPLMP